MNICYSQFTTYLHTRLHMRRLSCPPACPAAPAHRHHRSCSPRPSGTAAGGHDAPCHWPDGTDPHRFEMTDLPVWSRSALQAWRLGLARGGTAAAGQGRRVSYTGHMNRAGRLKYTLYTVKQQFEYSHTNWYTVAM